MAASFPVTFPSAVTTTPTTTLSAATHNDNLHIKDRDEIIAAQTKIGLGSSVASGTTVLLGTGGTQSAWGQITSGYIAPGSISMDRLAAGAAMVKIGEVLGTGASGVLEISSIPATYRSLLIELDGGRSTQTSATAAVVRMTFESSPTAGAYDNQRMLAGSTAVVGDENIGASDFINCGIVPANDSTTNVAGALNISLPGYAGTSAFKTALVLNCGPAVLSSGNLTALMSAGVWESTAAINRVRLTLSAGNWTSASRMTIWGLPAA